MYFNFNSDSKYNYRLILLIEISKKLSYNLTIEKIDRLNRKIEY
jgi:hypothetical protein